MNRKTKIILLLMLTCLVLAASATLSEADDTYNFYFQKAPGPQVVNQGTSGQTSAPQAAPAVATPSSAPIIAATSETAAPTPSEPEANYRKWEISFGYTSPFNHGHFQQADNFISPPQYYSLGLQYNASDALGLSAEYFHTVGHDAGLDIYGRPRTSGLSSAWAAGIVLSPLRFHLATNFGMTISLVGGVTNLTLPEFTGYYRAYQEKPRRTAGYYGGKVAIDLFRRVAVQATARRLSDNRSILATAGLAYLF